MWQIAPSEEESKKLKAYVEGPDRSPADLSSPERFLHVIGQVSAYSPRRHHFYTSSHYGKLSRESIALVQFQSSLLMADVLRQLFSLSGSLQQLLLTFSHISNRSNTL